MATEREIQETLARCVSIMVFYHQGNRSNNSRDLMVAEVQTLAAWVGDLGLDDGVVTDHILRPMETEMLARYGPEVGPRLAAAFRGAFEGPERPGRASKARSGPRAKAVEGATAAI